MKMTFSSVEPVNNEGGGSHRLIVWLGVFPMLWAGLLFLELQQGPAVLYSPVWRERVAWDPLKTCTLLAWICVHCVLSQRSCSYSLA